MIDVERLAVTVKLPFHKRIAFGGTEDLGGAINYFSCIRTINENYKKESALVIKLLQQVVRMGVKTGTFWLQGDEMLITFTFTTVDDTSLFLKLLPLIS